MFPIGKTMFFLVFLLPFLNFEFVASAVVCMEIDGSATRMHEGKFCFALFISLFKILNESVLFTGYIYKLEVEWSGLEMQFSVTFCGDRKNL